MLFGDFKQFPPATSRPAFIALSSVRKLFRFALLRENRRVVKADGARAAELNDFPSAGTISGIAVFAFSCHTVLQKIAFAREGRLRISAPIIKKKGVEKGGNKKRVINKKRGKKGKKGEGPLGDRCRNDLLHFRLFVKSLHRSSKKHIRARRSS